MQKTQESYAILLTQDMMEELQLVEGSPVEVRPLKIEATTDETAISYVSKTEALEIYERSKARFGQAYEVLAK